MVEAAEPSHHPFQTQPEAAVGHAAVAAEVQVPFQGFPGQVMLFQTAGRGNVIVCAVKYREPVVTDPAAWPTTEKLAQPPFAGRLNLDAIRAEHAPLPELEMKEAPVLTDDFAPVEFLDVVKANNQEPR